MVVFSITEANKKFVDAFIDSYITKNIDPKEYAILDISKVEKAEVVSANERDYDKLEELDKMSIERIEIDEEEEEVKLHTKVLTFLLIIMIILLGGITYLYFFPEKLMTEYLQIECKNNPYNEELKMKYHSYKVLKFNKSNLANIAEVTDTYTFDNSNDYLDFKNNHKETEYFHVNGEYQYDDKHMTLTLMYTEEAAANTYDDLTSYMKTAGYDCKDGKYYE